MKVRAYRNVTNGLISLMSCESRLVIGHADSITLKNVIFLVNERARQKVLETKRKNVHAFAVGDFVEAKGFQPYKDRQITPSEPQQTHEGSLTCTVRYNPYKASSFMCENGTPIHDAMVCAIDKSGNILVSER